MADQARAFDGRRQRGGVDGGDPVEGADGVGEEGAQGVEAGGGEFTDAVTRAAERLRSLGAGPGSVVGILVASNSPMMFYVRYAAHRLGAAVCYLRTTNPGSSARILPVDAQLRILVSTSVDVLYADRCRER
ncbi:AMP-binding protein [Streptomyces javensis]|uniref:AMP-binding protein n=1 Tax=Streptomyces javensis TaxID=114698 RepID=A0ABS0RI03_9ACTN|nr:AMP-binding protein [Streptomyces javensis]